MEKERVIRASILNQPVHRSQDILLRRLAHRVLLIIGKYDHVVPLVTKIVVQECRHVFNIIYATTQLSPLPKIVDSNQQRLPPSPTIRILVSIVLGCTTTKAQHA